MSSENAAIGTLCVVGLEPRSLDSRGKVALRTLGDAVMALLERRRKIPWRPEANALLFERNPNPMWIYDEESLRFLAVDDAATRQYGYSREEFAAMTLFDVRPAEDSAVLAQHLSESGHGLSHSNPACGQALRRSPYRSPAAPRSPSRTLRARGDSLFEIRIVRRSCLTAFDQWAARSCRGGSAMLRQRSSTSRGTR